MARTISDFIINRLSEWGIERIYGYPGDGINGLMAALERQQERVRVQARHLVDRALRIAKAEQTVTCICIPNDIQEQPYKKPPRTHGATFSGSGSSGSSRPGCPIARY